MRPDTVDWVMFILRAASMKLPVSATIKNVRARLISIEITHHKKPPEIYLSESSIVVTGNFRLKVKLNLRK
jgi:hypothetical protein